MVKSKKMAAAASVLASIALLAFGAVPAVGAENPGTCAKDDKGNLRCVQVREYRVTQTDERVRIDNNMSQTCSGGKGELSCASDLVVG
ncbi:MULTISPECIES: hypothetical protein [Streptomyces]|jgi:hypothetical protein|uniref:Secreted protein n=2 Tax=Streptomyces TaxID=1883 RepID=A0ABU3JE96_9ACTN|nr:hypothetical protein [Streptomyces sp. McG7]MBT2906390.1 hypothetical protein [Streptomyces sp. McG8]MDQ0490922.1 hypothetical protein [Streptomyces thermodiastaticus]MDT6973384.1 hypothetical protein [Streptomyces thermocarboxydus]MDX3418819.1 hypothetical protein [Streptomyces sp. MD20-1-1]MXQ58525.1 hypothetical protein [Streptomyces sp. XHT-2]MYW54323.1 hypothetical protein [Streptomyces sp. SID8376]THC47974.1 hypothetical protein E7X38_32085 [Streptomyces sp. Akac8]WSB41504.1 hypoth